MKIQMQMSSRIPAADEKRRIEDTSGLRLSGGYDRPVFHGRSFGRSIYQKHGKSTDKNDRGSTVNGVNSNDRGGWACVIRTISLRKSDMKNDIVDVSIPIRETDTEGKFLFWTVSLS